MMFCAKRSGAIAVVVAICGVIWIAGRRNSEDEIGDKGVEARPLRSSRLNSTEARENLREVLDGSRPEPSVGNVSAWQHYYDDTEDWIDLLSLSDCETLLAGRSEREFHHSLFNKIYRRYGELDPQGAIASLGGVPSEITRSGEVTIELVLICYVLEGWGKAEPEDAWSYFRSWRREDGTNPIRFAMESRGISRAVFKSWSTKDPAAAYDALVGSPREDFEKGSVSYYRGLPPTVDFSVEAEKFDRLLAVKRERKELWWASGNTKPDDFLGLLLATKWCDQNPDEAENWWLERETWGIGFRSTPERESHWLGKLVASWAGAWEVNNPDAVLRWLDAHPERIQEQHFREQVFPALAKWRPDSVADLVLEVEGALWQASALRSVVSTIGVERSENVLQQLEIEGRQLEFIEKAIEVQRLKEQELVGKASEEW